MRVGRIPFPMICTLLVIAGAALQAQPADVAWVDSSFFRSQRIGLHEMVDFTSHRADFTGLPGVPSCCPQYTDGRGVGASFGLLYERPLGGNWLLNGRLVFESVAGTFRSRESTTFIVQGKPTPGAFEHTLETSYGSLGLQPTIGYRFFDSLLRRFDIVGYVGGGIAIPIHSGYDQHERIVEPQDIGIYTESGTSTHNISSNAIPEIAAVLFDLRVGLAIDIPLNRTRTLLLAPEFWYVHGLTDVLRTEPWRTREIRGGLVFKYLLPGE